MTPRPLQRGCGLLVDDLQTRMQVRMGKNDDRQCKLFGNEV